MCEELMRSELNIEANKIKENIYMILDDQGQEKTVRTTTMIVT